MTDIETGLGYYSAPGPLTRISQAHADLLDGLPGDIESLCAVVQGVIVHPQLTTLYGLESSESRTMAERELRSLDEMLSCIRALDSRPLAKARPTDRKLVGTCRSSARVACGSCWATSREILRLSTRSNCCRGTAGD